MAKINFGKIKESLRDAADIAAGAAKEAAKNVKVPDIKVSDIKVPDVKVPKDFSILKKKNSDDSSDSDDTITCLSTNSAIQIFYYLMSVDGHIDADEEDSFALIAQELDPNSMDRVEENVEICKKQLELVEDVEDFYDIVQDGVEKAIHRSIKTRDSFITPKLLIWDMLSIAFSDGNYDETERKLIKYVALRLNIDKAVFLELESSMYTLVDLEKELKWIKTTNRPYLTIEAMVNEIADRKNVIFESVKDLIAL